MTSSHVVDLSKQRVTDDASERAREFRFERQHFNHIAGLLYRLAGIHLAAHKIEMMYARLARRLRALGLVDFDAYCALLDGPDGHDELAYLVNALTTNLTNFYREPHHFRHLGEVTLPEVAKRQADRGRPRLRLWSAGCSSGQEPYTLAMVVAAELAGNLPRWDARILATDIDTHMVETARRGSYSIESAVSIPEEIRTRFTRTQRHTDGTDRLQMGEELRRLITFKPLNLLEDWPMRGPFDAIFCRNVLIYFDRPGRSTVIERFHGFLVSGGYLYLGHSESLYGVSSRFRQIGATIYRRVP